MSDYAKRKAEGLARGDASARLEKLLATETAEMTRDQLQDHREAINLTIGDKAAGA